jgi:general secretion pathway protein E
MIGEIRDAETAQIAIQASLTGHLVLSTLHTNDSASAITRLIDMGVEPYLISSSVVAVMAQRLLRVICPHCKKPHRSKQRLSLGKANGKVSTPNPRLYKGLGCPECLQTGYLGRTGIFELLIVDDDIKEIIIERSGSHVIQDAAAQKGMRTLRENGLHRALAGHTTLEEVYRVTQDSIQTNKGVTDRARSAIQSAKG